MPIAEVAMYYEGKTPKNFENKKKTKPILK